MWDLAISIFSVVTTVLALVYAHHAHRQSIQAPILKLALGLAPFTNNLESTKWPTDIVLRLSRSGFGDALDLEKGEAKGFKLPIIIRNVGTKTARGIVLRVRYSIALGVIGGGQRVEDVDRPEWIVIDHRISDLNPKSAYKFEGDFLVPTEALVHGIPVETSAMTKDRKKVFVKARAEVKALVEIVLYSADTDPVFLACRVKVEDDGKAELPAPSGKLEVALRESQAQSKSSPNPAPQADV